MMESVSRTLIRTRTPTPIAINQKLINQQQQLFIQIRNLLRSNQPIEASNLFIINLDRQQVNKIHKLDCQDWLWKATDLFRSYNHPQLAFQLFQHLKSHKLIIPIKAELSAVQASSDLVWNYDHPQNYHHFQIQPHAHLAQSMVSLLITQPQENITTKNAPLSELVDQGLQKPSENYIQKSSVTSSSVHQNPNSRVLEVILSNILKLGDMDWMVSIFVNFYPNYTRLLGLYLYPNSPSSSSSHQKTTTTSKPRNNKLKPDEIPSGRLVKFLVKGYMMCKDFKRAHLVVKFHQSMRHDHPDLSSSENSSNDLTPEVTLLRGLSKTRIGSLERRMKIVHEIILHLSSRPISIDTYVLDALLETRYRLRSGWKFLRTQLSTFEVIRSIVEDHLRLFLIHWSRKTPSCHFQQKTTALIHGQHQGQQIIPAWKYRPSALTFTILLISLRNYLRFQTRPRYPTPSLDPHSYHPRLQQEVVQRQKKRRPSPGLHRTIVAQILGFENLNHSACPIMHSSATNSSGEKLILNNSSLPKEFQILTSKNLLLLVENLLLARDYPCIWILLQPSPPIFHPEQHFKHVHSTHLSPQILREISCLITSKLEKLVSNFDLPQLLLEDLFKKNPSDLHHHHPIQENSNNNNQQQQEKEEEEEREKLIQSIKTRLQTCFHLDSHFNHHNHHHHHSLDSYHDLNDKKINNYSWDSEINAILNRFNLEFNKIRLSSMNFSGFTLDFLRKKVSQDHLNQIFFGFQSDQHHDQ